MQVDRWVTVVVHLMDVVVLTLLWSPVLIVHDIQLNVE